MTTVPFAEAGEQTLADISADFAAAVTALVPDATVAFVLADRPGGSRFLGLLASSPHGEVTIGAHGAGWVEFEATTTVGNGLVHVADGIGELVDLTLARLTEVLV